MALAQPPKSAPKSAIVAWGASLAHEEYKGDPKKVAIATDAFGHGIDYMQSMPKGWNIGNTHEEFEARMYNHIKSNVNTKPYGFVIAVPVLSFFIWAIISGIIGWVVRRILDFYYPPHHYAT